MELEWYWPAEVLGLVTRLTPQPDNDYARYQVSSRADEVFLLLFLSLIPLLFLAGMWIRCAASRRGPALIRAFSLILLFLGLLQAVGVGPYIQFYPQSGGFVDFSVIEHILSGLYCAGLALSLLLGSCFGLFLRNNCKKRGERP